MKKLIPFLPLLFLNASQPDVPPHTTWATYRADAASTAYSALDQINLSNVENLEVAWTYQSGDAREGNRSSIQCNPIVADGRMYVSSPALKLMALDPETGRELWRFDPFAGQTANGTNRGVVYWESGSDKRVYFSAGPYLYALNAATGASVKDFGKNGRIDLREGLGRDAEKLTVWASSPGIVFQDLLIQGTALTEGYDAAPGFVRAYELKTGKIAWTFRTIPQPGEFGYDTWPKEAHKEVGGANSWAGLCLDEKRGLVFVPTGSAAFDFYGGNRAGENLFANCLLALDARSGKRIWHYQLVHHDLWDYDLPAPPTLVTLKQNGKTIDAVAQTTKMGMVFVFDRETGKPIFPIEERPVPPSALVGETTSPTQPFPTKPKPFVRQVFSRADISDVTPKSKEFLINFIKGATLGDIYTPPGVDGVVQFPGTRGGAEWGGPSFDPETGIMYVNANEVPLLVKMKKLETANNGTLAAQGSKLYALNGCAACHGGDRAGSSVYPSLANLSARRTEAEVSTILANGRGQMPAFLAISGKEKEALLAFLLDKNQEAKAATAEKVPTRYVHNGWNILQDEDGYPGVKPPWGTLNAIDLNKGEILWQVPLGEYKELMDKGLSPTGTQNLGGSVVTAGGLVFIGATKDEKFRAFDKRTGKVVWEYKLPFGGYATPSIYQVKGKQYIVIAAGGGGKVGSPSGDSYVAFRLK
ncbi:outer membrane protein assembly factor BamB family protein [Persicitalea jodogahamensis]|uniref:Cytochrome c domain-containing protein n=1 Tax=Persicitalea jodogahamensis TaxID=402147 RepID=A0A8J3D770_9BACT|nr:PQQ-binding-like beta-propeller repeat protein [Persicitalea jodogahamensis]GHB84353.1 hypothetical protein GCM10007390_44500 [Persicitalea jodogahamensis]